MNTADFLIFRKFDLMDQMDEECIRMFETLKKAGSRVLQNPPVLVTPDHLLNEDDFVRDGLVPLDLQQHVVVILNPQESKHR